MGTVASCNCPAPGYPRGDTDDNTTEFASVVHRSIQHTKINVEDGDANDDLRSSSVQFETAERNDEHRAFSSVTVNVAETSGLENKKLATEHFPQSTEKSTTDLQPSIYSLAHLEHFQAEPECIMCLDPFNSVPTLCACGMNKSLFHLSCLYEWIQHDKTCPICRSLLYFEESTSPRLERLT